MNDHDNDYDENFDSESSCDDNVGDTCSDQADDTNKYHDFAITIESLEGGVDWIEGSTSTDKLIYPNARISNTVSMLLIMTFAMTHKLSGAALKDLLSLIDIHCLIPNPLIQSLYKFKQFFKLLQHPFKIHHYCFKCGMAVEAGWSNCHNASCQQDFTSQNKSFFLELPITDQLKAFFKRKGFYNDLKHHFNRIKKEKNNIEDIYDGLRYQKHMQKGCFLANRNNISLLWNTDGASVFKSSNYSIWPLYFAINELPVHKRWYKHNVILGGLWFGSQKPNMLTFLKPFTESISNLQTNGVEVYSPDISSNFICRAMLLCGTCDLPAKAIVYNMKQYNGEYGCSHCLQSGKRLKLSTGGTVHVYPYIQSDPTGPTRTEEQTGIYAREAVTMGKPKFGVKGPSWLSTIPSYSIIDGNAIDYMHCVLLGVTKMLLSLWFDSQYSTDLWYCGNKVEDADSKLLQIKPPINISRLPRSIQNHRSYWKASEYRAWLLFYSVPVMFNILPVEYLAHHMLLVEAIYTLLYSSISPPMLDKAERMIKHYCFKMASYYTERQMTVNVHQLLHLPHIVLSFGPLNVYSCFAFESLNGCLLNFIKGTQHVEMQIIEAICKTQMLPHMAQNILCPESEPGIIYRQITKMDISSNTSIIGSDCIVLGIIEKKGQLSNPLHQEALMNITTSTQLGTFKRAVVKQTTFHSLSHTQSKKRNSYTVSYKYNGEPCHGEILYFITDFIESYAIILPFTNYLSMLPTDGITMCKVPHIHIYSSRSENNIHIVPISCISTCVLISFEQFPSTFFVIEHPNITERDL